MPGIARELGLVLAGYAMRGLARDVVNGDLGRIASRGLSGQSACAGGAVPVAACAVLPCYLIYPTSTHR